MKHRRLAALAALSALTAAGLCQSVSRFNLTELGAEDLTSVQGIDRFTFSRGTLDRSDYLWDSGVVTSLNFNVHGMGRDGSVFGSRTVGGVEKPLLYDKNGNEVPMVDGKGFISNSVNGWSIANVQFMSSSGYGPWGNVLVKDGVVVRSSNYPYYHQINANGYTLTASGLINSPTSAILLPEYEGGFVYSNLGLDDANNVFSFRSGLDRQLVRRNADSGAQEALDDPLGIFASRKTFTTAVNGRGDIAVIGTPNTGDPAEGLALGYYSSSTGWLNLSHDLGITTQEMMLVYDPDGGYLPTSLTLTDDGLISFTNWQGSARGTLNSGARLTIVQAPVPEPSLMVGAGLLAAAALARIRGKTKP